MSKKKKKVKVDICSGYSTNRIKLSVSFINDTCNDTGLHVSF